MQSDELLSYLAGVMDGDGYFKVVKEGHDRPYFRINIGLQQLWPGEAVRLFAQKFNGKLMGPMVWPGRRPMARCELYNSKAERAATLLIPYLQVKREQALFLLEAQRFKTLRDGLTQEWRERINEIREAVISLHTGLPPKDFKILTLMHAFRNRWYFSVNVRDFSSGELMSYLAGVMDGDGNFRIERRQVKGMLHPHYRINIRASQVLPSPAIHLLSKSFGGEIHLKRDAHPNHRPLEYWSLEDKKAVPALEGLLPYLVVKKTEAYLLLELRRLKAMGKKGVTYATHRTRGPVAHRLRKRCYTPEQAAEFERLHRVLQALHSGTLEEFGRVEEALATEKAPASALSPCAPQVF